MTSWSPGWKPEFVDLIGKTIQQVSDERGCAGVDATLSLLEQNHGRLRIISFNQSEANLRKVLTHRLTVAITDGLWTEGKPHPRTFVAYPAVPWALRPRTPLDDLDRSHTQNQCTAGAEIRIEGSRRIRPGYFADLAIFNADTINTTSSYLDPDQPPLGITHVAVSGSWAVRDGELQRSFAGHTLRGPA
jgi:N-acyl-D-amino-acid deacylase